MKKFLLTSLALTSMSFADITWQTTEELITPAGTVGITLTTDTAGNTINVITYSDPGPPLPLITTSIHTASGTSWGTLSDLGTTLRLGLTSFAGATDQFVVVLGNASNGALTSKTIPVSGTAGTEKTITNIETSATPARTPVAAGPSGNAILGFASSSAQTSYNAIYTASSDSWEVNPTSTDHGATIVQALAAADAGGNYGIAVYLDGGEGKVAWKIGTNDLTSYGQFDTGITEESLSLAAQVKSTDSDGLFLLTYIKSNNVYAQVKAAGTSTTLDDIGQISTTGDTLEVETFAAMNKNGDGIVTWLTDDSRLIGAKYLASTNTFTTPTTIATNAEFIVNATADSNGDFHVFYEAAEGLIITMTSASMSSTSSTWNTPVAAYANASGAEIESAAASGNPRSTKFGFAWAISTSLEHFATFGSVPSNSNHGASGGNLFRKGKYNLRPGRKPYR
ncbi:MAG: hypothetical protein P0S94_01960 [Simkaniaceae bacterium]|nr:hypothetical protein [Simkaniaceae bacterium]